MKIYVDIDETICFYNDKREYPNAVPNKKNIAKINKLYNEGYEITYWTARGTVTGINWFDLTKKQLKSFMRRKTNVYLTAEEAIKYGIADKILE